MSDPQTTVRSLTPGYRLNPQTAQRALYRLATMLLSYSGFKKADGRPLALQEQFLDDELSHLFQRRRWPTGSSGSTWNSFAMILMS